ncbi:MAG: ExbD/TolR family protein [Thermodesulfobacteriota bacterium]
MAFDSDRDGLRLVSEINITPFVDVMLVLLIIFMVSAQVSQGVDVNLPQAVSDPLESETDQVVVTLDAEGRVFINDEDLPLESLRGTLADMMSDRAERSVFFRADRAVNYGTAMRVMAEIKGAGVQKLGMVTESAGESGSPAESAETAEETGA